MNTTSGNREASTRESLNITAIFRILLRRIWIIVLVTILCFGGMFLYSETMITPTYVSSFTCYINNRINMDNIGSTSVNDLNASMGLAYFYQEIIVSRSVLQDAVKIADADMTYVELYNKVTTEVSENAPVITVMVEDTDPERAAKLASAIADAAPIHGKRIVEGSSLQIVDEPIANYGRYSPNSLQNALIGGFTGMLLCMVALVLIEMFNDRVQSSEDLELRYNITVLGTIPDIEQAQKNQSSRFYGKKGGEGK